MNDTTPYCYLSGELTPAKTLKQRLHAIAPLLLIMLVCLIPLLTALSRPDSSRTMENITFLSAQETWLRMHGTNLIPADPDAYLIPTRNNMPRFQKPPLAVWIDLIAYSGLKPGDPNTTPADLIYRSRLAAVAAGMILLAAIYWLGHNLGNRKLAIIATLAAGTMWLFQMQARIASYDIYLATFATLSLASIIAAIKPFREKPSTLCALGFALLSGLFAGAAVMTKGWPLGLMWSYVPAVILIVYNKETRLRALLLTLFALFVAAVVAAPWFIYALMHYKEAADTWIHEYEASRTDYQPIYYYIGFLGLILPWPLFFFGSLVHPFVRSSGYDKKRLLLPWLWFVIFFVAISIPAAKQQRYILPMVPIAALLVAQIWSWHIELAKRGERDPGGNFMVYPQWIGFFVASIALVVIQFFDASTFKNALDRSYVIGPVSYLYPIILGPTLIAISILGYRTHTTFKNPFKAFILAATWMLITYTAVWSAYSSSPARDHPIRAEAEAVMDVVGQEPMYVLYQPKVTDDVNEEFLIYSQRIVPRVNITDILQFTNSLTHKAYMIADNNQTNEALLTQTGWKPVMKFMQDKRRANTLYVHAPTAPIELNTPSTTE